MNRSWIRLCLIGGVLFALAPTSARADDFQHNLMALIQKVGVHGNVGLRHPTDQDVTRGVTVGPSVGLSPGSTNGWKYPIALSMFSEDLRARGGAEFGSIRTRALLAGIGYGWHFGRLSVGPQVEVGYAFNHSTMNGDAAQAFAAPGAVSMHADDGWILRPELKGEYFITPKVTFRTSVDYVRLEPNITVTTADGVMTDQWHMSNVHANVGIGFYPFRK
jgi:hypothetical protein